MQLLAISGTRGWLYRTSSVLDCSSPLPDPLCWFVLRSAPPAPLPSSSLLVHLLSVRRSLSCCDTLSIRPFSLLPHPQCQQRPHPQLYMQLRYLSCLQHVTHSFVCPLLYCTAPSSLLSQGTQVRSHGDQSESVHSLTHKAATAVQNEHSRLLIRGEYGRQKGENHVNEASR